MKLNPFFFKSVSSSSLPFLLLSFFHHPLSWPLAFVLNLSPYRKKIAEERTRDVKVYKERKKEEKIKSRKGRRVRRRSAWAVGNRKEVFIHGVNRKRGNTCRSVSISLWHFSVYTVEYIRKSEATSVATRFPSTSLLLTLGRIDAPGVGLPTRGVMCCALTPSQKPATWRRGWIYRGSRENR